MATPFTDDSLRRAADSIGAVDMGDDRWAHYDDGTGSYWAVDAADLAGLVAYLDDPDPERACRAHSLWCADTDADEMPRGWVPGRLTTDPGGAPLR